jgi:hypothetical protein
LPSLAIYANALVWGDEEGDVHYIAFDPAKLTNTLSKQTARTFSSKWEQHPKEKGLAGKCKRILGRIVGDLGGSR